MKIFSFAPIADQQSKVLILGTMPGKDSLKYNQYYAHSRNVFWKIIFTLFDIPLVDNYDVKQTLLLNKNIALWDVLKVCKRQGSLDANIFEEEANDLEPFFETHSRIKHLFFNGKSSLSYFTKHFKNISIPYTVLPSSSPAYTISFEKKISEWSVIKELI